MIHDHTSTLLLRLRQTSCAKKVIALHGERGDSVDLIRLVSLHDRRKMNNVSPRRQRQCGNGAADVTPLPKLGELDAFVSTRASDQRSSK